MPSWCNVKLYSKIPFELNIGALAGKLRVDRDSSDFSELKAMVDLAVRMGKPKAAYAEFYVDPSDGNGVVIGGKLFQGRLLARNLRGVGRVFPYVATCGIEMDEAAPSDGDVLKAFWWDAIKSELLVAVDRFLRSTVEHVFKLGKTAVMRPGAGDADIWPVERQRELFDLLDGVEDSLGVRLTESFLMIPNQTVSGVIYPTETNFSSCEVCRREGCPSRRAEFSEEMWNDVQRG